MNKYILYGMAASLYTGKVRSYLRRQGIAFEERPAGDPRFLAEVVPKTGRWIIPVVQTPDGTLLQDSADIIDHFERSGLARQSAYPASPVARVIAHIFELYGGEALLRPAMHYRWNFDADNLDFLRADFGVALAAPGSDQRVRDLAFERSSARMRKATISFGVTSESMPAIESSYRTFLALLDQHVDEHPFLLGGVPYIGDYGLFASMHAHLGRDPHPAGLMKRHAPRVWHWLERMNAGDSGNGEFLAHQCANVNMSSPPATLLALLTFIAEDYLAECQASVAFVNDWIAARPDLQTGSNGLNRPGDRSIGMMDFNWRGLTLKVAVMPYRLYLLQKIQDVAAAASPADNALVAGLLGRTGLSELLNLKTSRRIERHQHLEVWGPPRTIAP